MGKIRWRRILSMTWLILLAVIISGTTGSAYAADISGECGDNLTWEITDGVLTLSGEGQTDWTYRGQEDWPWFEYAGQIREVVIEEGITYIGREAFKAMPGLESVSFPSTLNEIGDSCFSMTGIRNLTITSDMTNIGSGAFYKLEQLETLVVDYWGSRDDVWDIFGSSFIGTDITITGNANVSLDAVRKFMDVGDVTVEEGGSDFLIEDQIVFNREKTRLLYYSYRRNDTSYTVPESVEEIGKDAFSENGVLVSVDLGKVRKIGSYAFYKMSRLNAVTLPDTLETVGSLAFAYCKSTLNTVYIPKDITADDSVFSGDNAETVEFGADVTSLPDFVQTMKSYRRFEVDAGNKDLKSVDGVLFSKDGTELVRYPGIIDDKVTYTIPSNVTRIGADALSAENTYGIRRNLTVILPDDLRLEEIGEEAFKGLKNLQGTLHLTADYKVRPYALCNSGIEKVILGDPDETEEYTAREIDNDAFAYYTVNGDVSPLQEIDAYGMPPQTGSNSFEHAEAILRYPPEKYEEWDAAIYDAEQRAMGSLLPIPREKCERAVVLVVDTSSSMDGLPIEALKTAAKKFTKSLLDSDYSARHKTEMALIAYNNDVNCIGFSSNSGTFTIRESMLLPTGGTDMSNALLCAKRYLNRIDAAEKDMILMTDGIPQHGTALESGPFNSADSSYYQYANGVYNIYTTFPQTYRMFSVGFYPSAEERAFSEKLMRLIQNSGYYSATDSDELVSNFDEIVDTLLNQMELTMYYSDEEVYDSDGNYNEITVDVHIDNGNDLTAKNVRAKIDVSEIDADGLVLAPGETEEKEVGDITEGSSSVVTWKLRAPVVTEDMTCHFSVKAGGDNVPAIKKYFEVYVQATSDENAHRYIYNGDKWSFAHNIAEYNLTPDLLSRLEEILTCSEMKEVNEKYLSQKVTWSGSCYGMSVSAAMFKSGKMRADYWQNGAVRTSDIGLDRNTNALLTYFQVLQLDQSLISNYLYKTVTKVEATDGKRYYYFKPNEDIINGLIQSLDKKGFLPVCIGYQGTNSEKETVGYGHAMIAFGDPVKAADPPVFNGVKYDYYIRTYDVNTLNPNGTRKDEKLSYIYYTADKSKVCVPMYMTYEYGGSEVQGLSGLHGWVTKYIDDISIFDEYNPENDNYHKETVEEKNERLRISSETADLKIRGGNKNAIVRGMDITGDLKLWSFYEEMTALGSEGSYLNILAGEPEETYTIETQNDDPLDIIASYDGSSAFVEGSADSEATLDGPESVSIKNNEGDYNLEIVLDEDEGFGNVIQVAGADNSDITVAKEAECFKVETGDGSLRNVDVRITKDGEVTDTTLDTDKSVVFVESVDGRITVSDQTSQNIDASDIVVTAGKSVDIGAAAKTELRYMSDNKAIATVDVNGVVKGIKPGKAIITIAATESDQYKAAITQIEVTVVAAKGKTYTVGNCKYKVTNADTEGKGEVTLTRPVKTSLKSISVPAAVKIGKVRYKVTGIGARAFAKNKKLTKVTIGSNVKTIGASAFAKDAKLKTVKVDSKVLKSVGKKALSGINRKATFKVPSSKKKSYTKLFRKGGMPKLCKVK